MSEHDPLPAPPAGLVGLVEASAPLWAGERLVVDRYWDWSGRTADTDRCWVLRQCAKELYDGVDVRLVAARAQRRAADAPGGWRRVLGELTAATEELAHLVAFADVLEALDGEGTTLDEARLRAASWPENEALVDLRARHRRDHGELGVRATAITEGGYQVLYASGAQLAGRGGVDEAIARACRSVLDDEWDHMAAGLVGLVAAGLDVAGWAVLSDLCAQQGRARIAMRQAQLSGPLPPADLAGAMAGHVAPLPFDWARAGFRPPPVDDGR